MKCSAVKYRYLGMNRSNIAFLLLKHRYDRPDDDSPLPIL